MERVYAHRRFSAHCCLLHRCCRGQCNWPCYAAVSGCAFATEAQHHRLHQAAVAASSEGGRQLHDHVSVDWPSAVLQHSLLLTLSYFLPTPSAAKALPRETLGGHLLSPTAQDRLGWRLGYFRSL